MGFKASGIRQQGGSLAAAMMGDPGLLQEGPDVSTLLPEGGDDREQTAAAQRLAAEVEEMRGMVSSREAELEAGAEAP